MEGEKVVFVRCDFRRGGFPSERVFVLHQSERRELRGTAPVQYCYTADRRPLGDEPAHGETVAGLVVGLEIPGTAPRVYLPDGNVYDLDASLIMPVPRGGVENVPVGA